MADLPSSVSYATVVGRFLAATLDDLDAGGTPQGKPITDIDVTLTSSAGELIRDTATPALIHPEPIVLRTNDAGVLINPETGAESTKIIATDDPDLQPTGWTWVVEIRSAGYGLLSRFSMIAPAGSTIDLALATPVPESPGSEVAAWQLAVTQAEAARDEAAASAATLTELGLRSLIIDELASDATVEDAAVAAMQDAAVQAQLAWVKGTVGTATNYNALTGKGVYLAASGSVAASMVNRPTAVDAGNPLAIEVIPISANHILQRVAAITVAASMPSWERQYLNGTWSAWKETTVSAPFTPKQLASSTNLGAFFTVGKHYARTSSVVSTIVDKPLGSDGNPFAVEVELISDANNIYRQTFTQVTVGNSAGSSWVRYALNSVYGDWQRLDDARRWDKRNLDNFGGAVRFWGDSLVAASTLPETLDSLVTETVVNVGRSGDTANEVLLRAGVLTLYASPAGGSIPASGAVTVTVGGARLGLRDNRAFACTIAGVPGTLTHVTGESWSFARTTEGTAVAVTGSAPVFISGTPRPTDVHLFIMGENDAWWNPTNRPPDADIDDHLVSVYQRAVDAVTASGGEKHVLIGGIKTTQSTVPGDARDLLVQDVNGRLKALFPAYFVDRQKWLATDALAAAGIAPTQADIDAMTAGLVPPSAFSDDLHIKTEVVAAEASALWLPALAVRGWVTEA